LSCARGRDRRGVSKNALSRWENNQELGEKSDRSIRITCGLAIIEEVLNDQANTGSVNIDRVKHALKTINQYLAKSVKGDVASDDPDEFVIDADFPFTLSVVSTLSDQ